MVSIRPQTKRGKDREIDPIIFEAKGSPVNAPPKTQQYQKKKYQLESPCNRSLNTEAWHREHASHGNKQQKRSQLF
jgi:hypothetical protein